MPYIFNWYNILCQLISIELGKMHDEMRFFWQEYHKNNVLSFSVDLNWKKSQLEYEDEKCRMKYKMQV